MGGYDKKKHQTGNQNAIHADAMMQEVSDGGLDVLKKFINAPDANQAVIDIALPKILMLSIVLNKLDITKYILSSAEIKNKPDPREDESMVLRFACTAGNEEAVRFLLSGELQERTPDVHAVNNMTLLWACVHGHTNIVNFLVMEKEMFSLEDLDEIDFEGFSDDMAIEKNDVIDIIKTRQQKKTLEKLIEEKAHQKEETKCRI